MKNTAKILSLFLCLVMALSVGLSIVVNAADTNVPTFSLKEVKTESIDALHNKVTVSVNLESGSFNALDFRFSKSATVIECREIKSGSKLDSGVMPMYNPKAPSNKSQVAMVSVDGQKQTGEIVIAEFKVLKNSDYSISLSIDNCQITDSNSNNIDATPKISSSINYKKPDPSTTKSTTTTKSTPKSTTTTTTKSTPTTRSTSTTTTTTRRNSSNQVSSSAGYIPNDIMEALSTEPSSTGEYLDYDDYSSDYYYDQTQYSEPTEAASLDDVMEDSKLDKKVIVIVAVVVALIIAGAVTAVILIKKKNNGAANQL